mmetsp:Transcript_3842/g.5967  ORF Transcript_3842/g.5967 Transcript_3842/m.5967 type:complete len:941 (-) Transcript_3842:210-3032(-)
MAPTGRSQSICIVHPDSEESADFKVLGDTRVEFSALDQASCIYEFDRVLAQRTSQEQVFQEVAKSPVFEALENFQSTFFLAFGATGSGKTFAVTGGAKRFADRGLIPRSISALFEALTARPDKADFQVAVSFFEIYKEYVVDLLSERRRRVPVQQARGQEVVLEGLLKTTAASESDAYHLLFQGDSNRHFEKFPANAETSRGHVFYILHLTHIPTGREASLSFVDLAAVIGTKNHATVAIKRGLDALKAAVAAMLAGEQPLFEGQLLTQLLQPALQHSSLNVALICPIRYMESTSKDVHSWLEFAKQFQEALSPCERIFSNEENGDENFPPQMQGQTCMTKNTIGGLQPHPPRPPQLQEMNFEVSSLQPATHGHFHHSVLTSSGETVQGPYLSPVHAASDIHHGFVADVTPLQRDSYAYQGPTAEIATASEYAQQTMALGQNLQSPQAFAPTMAPPSTPLAPPSWSPQRGTNPNDLIVDVRTASEATLPPMPMNLTGESPTSILAFDSASLTQDLNNGSFILAEADQAGCAPATFAASPKPVATAFSVGTFSDVSGAQLHAFAQDAHMPPAPLIASSHNEAMRGTRIPQLIAHTPAQHAAKEEAPVAVMRAQYLQHPINHSGPAEEIGASGNAQRVQDCIAPASQKPASGSASIGSYPGTLIVPQVPPPPPPPPPPHHYLSSGLNTQASLTSTPNSQAPLTTGISTLSSMPPGSATAPVGTAGASTPAVPASPLPHHYGSFVPKVGTSGADAPLRSRTPPAPSRAVSSPLRSGGTARVSVGPARARNSGVASMARPSSPLPKRSSSPLPPRSPSPLQQRSVSPMLQRSPSHAEMPGSSRANMYASGGRPMSPHPCQPNSFPSAPQAPGNAGIGWAVPWSGCEGVVSAPPASPFAGTPVRMMMGPPRSLSPQQDRHALIHSPGHDSRRSMQYMQFRGQPSR